MGATGALRDLKPWTTYFLVPRSLPQTDRVAAMLDAVALEELGGARAAAAIMQNQSAACMIKEALSGVLLDVSQNPVRRAWTNSAGVAKCLHTNTQLFSYKRNRALLPLELMMLQGHTASLKIPETMSANDLHDLACMGISLPCLGVIFASLALSVGL